MCSILHPVDNGPSWSLWQKVHGEIWEQLLGSSESRFQWCYSWLTVLKLHLTLSWIMWFRNCTPQFSDPTKTLQTTHNSLLHPHFPLPFTAVVQWRGELEAERAKIKGWDKSNLLETAENKKTNSINTNDRRYKKINYSHQKNPNNWQYQTVLSTIYLFTQLEERLFYPPLEKIWRDIE